MRFRVPEIPPDPAPAGVTRLRRANPANPRDPAAAGATRFLGLTRFFGADPVPAARHGVCRADRDPSARPGCVGPTRGLPTRPGRPRLTRRLPSRPGCVGPTRGLPTRPGHSARRGACRLGPVDSARPGVCWAREEGWQGEGWGGGGRCAGSAPRRVKGGSSASGSPHLTSLATDARDGLLSSPPPLGPAKAEVGFLWPAASARVNAGPLRSVQKTSSTRAPTRRAVKARLALSPRCLPRGDPFGGELPERGDCATACCHWLNLR